MKPLVVALVLMLTACNASAPPAPVASEAPVAAVAEPAMPPAAPQPLLPAAASWLGKWTGPEGTFLELTEADGAYSLTIQSLDGPATYAAVAVEDRIEFQRNGAAETIRATSGAETGMKWLLDKKNCLTIKTGEGFCRD